MDEAMKKELLIWIRLCKSGQVNTERVEQQIGPGARMTWQHLELRSLGNIHLLARIRKHQSRPTVLEVAGCDHVYLSENEFKQAQEAFEAEEARIMENHRLAALREVERILSEQ